ncbi:MAG: twin-arginine translocation signal domain-containing protein [Pirellulaceae bacterium]
MTTPPSRRNFIKTSTATAGSLVAASQLARTVHAAGSDEIRFVVIGLGGRGSGAAVNIMETKGNVKLVAVADAFGKRAAYSIQAARRSMATKSTSPRIASMKGSMPTKRPSIPIAIWL